MGYSTLGAILKYADGVYNFTRSADQLVSNPIIAQGLYDHLNLIKNTEIFICMSNIQNEVDQTVGDRLALINLADVD